jgi:hypothetical protein
LLNNQIKFAQGNEEFKNQQQELINGILEKFEHIKELLGKQKEFSGRLNECIKTSLANIIATKTNYKNELIKIQDNIKYDIINNNDNGNNQNLMNQINDISNSINDFKNKIDLASNIYLNNNSSNSDINNINNNCCSNNAGNIIIENENSENKKDCKNIQGSNRLKKLFSEVNGGGFKF